MEYSDPGTSGVELELGWPPIIWPNRSWADYCVVGCCFLLATLVAIAFLVAWTSGAVEASPALLVLVGVFIGLPVVAGREWLKRATNFSVTVTAVGLTVRNSSGSVTDIMWDSIYAVFWYGSRRGWSSGLELKYTDGTGDRRQVSIRPLARRIVWQVEWLRDHTVERCELKKVPTRRRVTWDGAVPWEPTKVWLKPANEDQ